MSQRQPFLLDPNYRDKLDSDEWRRHFLRINHKDAGSEWAGVIAGSGFGGCFVIAGAVCAFLAYQLPKGELYALGGVLAGFGLLVNLFVLIVMPGERAEKKAFQKMTSELVLVEGELTDCKVESGTDAEGDRYYFLTVSFRAVAPNGKEVKGSKRFPRNDLKDLPPPAAGRPVFVMTLPDGSRASLL